MNPSFSASAVAEYSSERPAQRLNLPSRQFPQNSGHALVDSGSVGRKIVGGGFRIPHFLTNRTGLNWAKILTELRFASGSDAEYHRILNGLMDFVETDVVGTSTQPRHGSGLMVGQPLTAGWRRRLYVCPVSNRLEWIRSSVGPRVPAHR